MHWERAIFVTLCSSCLTGISWLKSWVSSLVIHVHVSFFFSSTFSSSTSTCLSLSSFPSTFCTASCTLSSTTWSPCKTCATPRTRGVATPTTSPTPPQVLIWIVGEGVSESTSVPFKSWASHCSELVNSMLDVVRKTEGFKCFQGFLSYHSLTSRFAKNTRSCHGNIFRLPVHEGVRRCI